MWQDLIIERLIWWIPLVLSITVHEWAHAASASWLGDDTSRLLGRNTLNPLAHIDPVGTVLLPLLGIPFGWAEPVPINPIRFRRNVRMKLGVLIVAIAGPISNFCLAGLCWLLLKLLVAAQFDDAEILEGLSNVMALNLVLAIFNLLPIPPLDGSRVVDSLMPAGWRPLWNSFSRFGLVLLLALILIPQFVIGFNLIHWFLQTSSFRLP